MEDVYLIGYNNIARVRGYVNLFFFMAAAGYVN